MLLCPQMPLKFTLGSIFAVTTPSAALLMLKRNCLGIFEKQQQHDLLADKTMALSNAESQHLLCG